MADTWRVIDTGLRSAAQNIALNRALLEARQADESPSTLRFLRFTPSALVGFHQSPAQELDIDYCREAGVAIQRRITGGGAIYFDETQIGWELYLHKRDLGSADMQAISRRICEAAARGISALGVDARFRPRNDIEVEGRKISGTGGVFEGDALMYQGTLLVQFDVERMLRVLRIPAEKLSGKAIQSARDRVANLADLLGHVPAIETVHGSLMAAFRDEFGVDFCDSGLVPEERGRYHEALAEIESDGWVGMLDRPRAEAPMVEAMRKFPGGLLRVGMVYDRVRNRVRQIHFSGDFFVHPKRVIADLEAHLRDSDAARLEDGILGFFAQHQVDMLGLAAGDFALVAQEALQSALGEEAQS